MILGLDFKFYSDIAIYTFFNEACFYLVSLVCMYISNIQGRMLVNIFRTRKKMTSIWKTTNFMTVLLTFLNILAFFSSVGIQPSKMRNLFNTGVTVATLVTFLTTSFLFCVDISLITRKSRVFLSIIIFRNLKSIILGFVLLSFFLFYKIMSYTGTFTPIRIRSCYSDSYLWPIWRALITFFFGQLPILLLLELFSTKFIKNI